MLPKKSKFSEEYQRFEEVADRVVRSTDIGRAPGTSSKPPTSAYRDMTTGRTLLHEMQEALAQAPHDERRLDDSPSGSNGDMLPSAPEARITLLDRIDLTQTIAREDYRDRLAALQSELNDLAWRAYTEKLSTVFVFEGVDAAGKEVRSAGSPRRWTRGCVRSYRSPRPTDEESAHHYLWRFWRHIPAPGGWPCSTAPGTAGSWSSVSKVSPHTPTGHAPTWRSTTSRSN